MSFIVFACKSNSCRSQMAEGWAREWIRNQKQILAEQLKISDGDKNCRNNNITNSNNINGYHKKSTINDIENDDVDIEEIQQRISNIDKIIVTSVALDSSAVFEYTSLPGTSCNTADCFSSATATAKTSRGDLCETPCRRKAVKLNAVAAMAQDGVDISNFIPNTIDEIMNILSREEGDSPIITTHKQKNHNHGDLKDAFSTTDLISTFSSTFSTNPPLITTDNPTASEENATCSRPVDKLILLCSCGDNLKKNLIRRSKSVEEWEIDAPTAAAKMGEGEGAYRRVSLQIRDEVNILMESLFMK